MSDDLNMVQPGTADTPDVASTPEWEAVGEAVATRVAAVVQSRLTPIIRKAADDLYADVLSASEDYLAENVAFNIAARLRSAERAVMEAYQLRAQNAALRIALREAALNLDACAAAIRKGGKNNDRHILVEGWASNARAAMAKATPSDTHEVG